MLRILGMERVKTRKILRKREIKTRIYLESGTLDNLGFLMKNLTLIGHIEEKIDREKQ